MKSIQLSIISRLDVYMGKKLSSWSTMTTAAIDKHGRALNNRTGQYEAYLVRQRVLCVARVDRVYQIVRLLLAFHLLTRLHRKRYAIIPEPPSVEVIIQKLMKKKQFTHNRTHEEKKQTIRYAMSQISFVWAELEGFGLTPGTCITAIKYEDATDLTCMLHFPQLAVLPSFLDEVKMATLRESDTVADEDVAHSDQRSKLNKCTEPPQRGPPTTTPPNTDATPSLRCARTRGGPRVNTIETKQQLRHLLRFDPSVHVLDLVRALCPQRLRTIRSTPRRGGGRR